MNEKEMNLLKIALKLGEQATNELANISELGEDFSHDYILMKEDLAKILGIDYSDLSD